MAAKIGVLKPHQDISDRPCTYVKKAVAALLVRRLIAEDIRRGLIRMLAVNPAQEIPAVRLKARPETYVPEILPPIEIPGLHFEEPNIRHNPDAAIVRQLKAVMA